MPNAPFVALRSDKLANVIKPQRLSKPENP
jgi:hypothetical protein